MLREFGRKDLMIDSVWALCTPDCSLVESNRQQLLSPLDFFDGMSLSRSVFLLVNRPKPRFSYRGRKLCLMQKSLHHIV